MWSFLGIALSSALTVVSLVLTRHAAMESGSRQDRTRSYDLMRWAVDTSLIAGTHQRLAGLEILRALVRSRLVHPDDREFMLAVLAAASRRDGVR